MDRIKEEKRSANKEKIVIKIKIIIMIRIQCIVVHCNTVIKYLLEGLYVRLERSRGGLVI